MRWDTTVGAGHNEPFTPDRQEMARSPLLAAAMLVRASVDSVSVSVPDFIRRDDLCKFEPPMTERERLEFGRSVWPSTVLDEEPCAPPRMYEYADPQVLEPVSPGEWLVTAKRRRRRTEWHPVARHLAAHADRDTGRNVRCSVKRMADHLGKSRENCNRHVRRLSTEGWLRMTGKAQRGVIVYALAIPPEP